MRRVRKFTHLPREDRRLLLRAYLLVWKYRLMLWLLPFRRVRPHLSLAARAREASGSVAPSPWKVAWAVGAAARLVLDATCLTQALAAHRLCARYGYVSRVRLGTGRSESGEFVAHAWLESNGQVLVGAGGLDRYVPLPDLTGERP